MAINLSNEVSNALADSTIESIQQTTVSQLQSIFNQLCQIKDKVYNQMGWTVQPKSLSGLTIQDESLRIQLFVAYELIQQVRQILTGEILTYRLYLAYELESSVEAKYLDIGSDQLEKLLVFSAKEIDISANKLKKAMEAEPSSVVSIDNYYGQAMQYFKHPSRGKSRKILFIPNDRSDVFQYQLFKSNGRSWGVYNRGHIVEAVDKAIDKMKAAQLEEDDIQENFKDAFFSELSLDNVSGFKGGDNAMRQIKANSARLMRYSSIIIALNSVLSIFYDVSNPQSKRADIAARIKKMYDSGGVNNAINSDLDPKIDKFIDTLLQIKTS